MVKRDTFRGNISKKLRRRIRSINNGYQKAKIFVRPRKY